MGALDDMIIEFAGNNCADDLANPKLVIFLSEFSTNNDFNLLIFAGVIHTISPSQ